MHPWNRRIVSYRARWHKMLIEGGDTHSCDVCLKDFRRDLGGAGPENVICPSCWLQPLWQWDDYPSYPALGLEEIDRCTRFHWDRYQPATVPTSELPGRAVY